MGIHGLLWDSFTFLYVYDVCTSQETHLGPHRPITGKVLRSYT
jgi:hypothetical protein